MRSSVRIGSLALVAIAVPAIGCQTGRLAPAPGAKGDGGASVRAEVPAPVGDGGRRIQPTTACSVADADLPADAVAASDALVSASEAAYERGQYEEAWTCADRAADLDPRSAGAQQLRAASWAALDDFVDAQDAYSLALALDPDDVQVLAAAADFYLHERPEISDDDVALALALAQRGLQPATRAAAKGLESTIADLYALAAEAEDDLGQTPAALSDADLALDLVPDHPDAAQERALVLFDLERFPEAAAAYRAILAHHDDDALAHDGLGLALEWLGDAVGSQRERARATALAPDDFPPPVQITPEEFHAVVVADAAALDAPSRALLAAVALETPDRPALDDLRAVDPPFPPTILGMYRGAPVGQPPQADDPPRAIVIYRLDLLDAVGDREDLEREIDKTLRHELAHAAGDDEDQVRRRGLE